jgi:CubicO group peptidase (beta-lactamase class C family)
VKDITIEPVIVHMAHRAVWFLNLRREFLAILVFLTFHAAAARADEVDDLIAARMRERQIVGSSVAVIDEGRIVKAKGYGFTDKSRSTPVTTATLFQAGSISKSVAAMGAMRLVQDGRLLLDEDVNSKLRTWKMPENEFTKDKKVTLRGILSHTAGLTVHGFPGYAVGDAVPTVVQVLDGAKPANTAAVRVDFVPGSKWRYSGGGYTVMQQLIVDVTDTPYPTFMKSTVLTPLGMTSSTFEQPLPDEWVGSAATGHMQSGDAVKGRWHVYPEMAAAGLWTTPSDLARFVIAVQQSLAGRENTVLSQQTTRLMLTEQKESDALGVFVDGKDKSLRFFHGGRDAGFDAQMVAYAHVGRGVVIMMNVNEDAGTMKEIVNVIAKQYGWSAGAEPQAK